MADDSHLERGDSLEDQGRLDEAFAEFMAGAELGDPHCMTRLAVMYTLGMGVNCCDYDKAIEWEARAYEAGDLSALFNMGISYRIKGDIVAAKECFEEALEAGYSSAALQLAKLYIVSPKEVEVVRKYLLVVVGDSSLSESDREEAEDLLLKL